ncbi:hypothetical protein ACTFIZ_002673 [Dictyostelium cf. discoideum]
MEDELYNEIIMVLKDSTILGFGANDEKKYRGIRKFYTFRETSDGKITLIKNVIDKLRIVPRRRELPAIFNKYHDESSHDSKNVLMRETMIGYFWPTKTVDIDAYVNNCEYCNEFKKRFGKAPSKRDRPIVLEETKGIISKRPYKRKSKEPASSKTKTTNTKSSKETEEGPWGSILEKKKKDSDSDIDSEHNNNSDDNDDSDNSNNTKRTSGTKRLKSSKNHKDNDDDDDDNDNDNDNNNDNNDNDEDDDYKEENEKNEEENFKPKRLGHGRRQSTISSISDDDSEIL